MVEEKNKSINLESLDIDNMTDEELYKICFNAMLERSRNDLKNGRYCTLEESIEEMKKKHEDFYA